MRRFGHRKPSGRSARTYDCKQRYQLDNQVEAIGLADLAAKLAAL
jgi:hypothetical protein